MWSISIFEVNENKSKLLFDLSLTLCGQLIFEHEGKYFKDTTLEKEILSFVEIEKINLKG